MVDKCRGDALRKDEDGGEDVQAALYGHWLGKNGAARV
jgi:hypothetical protein